MNSRRVKKRNALTYTNSSKLSNHDDFCEGIARVVLLTDAGCEITEICESFCKRLGLTHCVTERHGTIFLICRGLLCLGKK